MIVKSCISWVILPLVYYLMGKKLVKFNFNELGTYSTFFFLLDFDDWFLDSESLLQLVDGICVVGCNEVGDKDGISSI